MVPGAGAGGGTEEGNCSRELRNLGMSEKMGRLAIWADGQITEVRSLQVREIKHAGRGPVEVPPFPLSNPHRGDGEKCTRVRIITSKPRIMVQNECSTEGWDRAEEGREVRPPGRR